MKRKILLALSLVGVVALGSCTKSTDSSSPSSEKQYPDVTVSTKTATVSVERGDSTTLRFQVAHPAGDSTVSSKVNFTVTQDAEILTYDENALNEVTPTLKVTGNKVGTATVTATSVSNPNATATITVTVTKRIPELAKVWTSVISNTNYTIKTQRVISDDEKDAIEDEADKDSVDYEITRVTDKAVTQHLYDGDKEVAYYTADNAKTPMYAADEAGTLSLIGYGLDKNGYAVPLEENISTGAVTVGSTIARTNAGLLKASNFAGAGKNATSPNDVSFVYGLQAINPTWFANIAKVSGNEYEIKGTSDDHNALYVEVSLWNILDPVGYMKALRSSTQFVDIANTITTKITALSADSIKIEITGDDAYTASDGNKYPLDVVATLEDVGTTEISSPAGLATAEGEKPDLGTEFNLAVAGARGDNYIMSKEQSVTIDNKQELTLATNYYYTKDYVFLYRDATFVSNYNKYIDYLITNKQKKDDGSLYTEADKNEYTGGFGMALVKGADGIYLINYNGEYTTTEASKDGTSTTTEVTHAAGFQAEPANASLGIAEGGKFTGTTATSTVSGFIAANEDWKDFFPGYLTSNGLFDSTKDDIYLLSSTATQIFEGMDPIYYSLDQAVFNDVLTPYLDSASIAKYSGATMYIGGFSIKTTTDENKKAVLSSLELLGLYSSDGRSFRGFIGDYSDFGAADTKNPVKDSMATFIATLGASK
ncbi:MAG: hypothetical protein PUA93_03010 [Eubacteriales bacterium]|nr:hypothetical protein [Eubacteriales bacterium]